MVSTVAYIIYLNSFIILPYTKYSPKILPNTVCLRSQEWHFLAKSGAYCFLSNLTCCNIAQFFCQVVIFYYQLVLLFYSFVKLFYCSILLSSCSILLSSCSILLSSCSVLLSSCYIVLFFCQVVLFYCPVVILLDSFDKLFHYFNKF